MALSPQSNRRLLVGAISLFLLAPGCAEPTAENMARVKRIGCVAGTLLSVAANNFGAHYLQDAARIVSMFSGSSFSPGASEPGVGCADTGPVTSLAGDPGVQQVAVDQGGASEESESFEPDLAQGEPEELAIPSGNLRPRLDVALLRQVAEGGQTLEPIPDGAVLSRAAGDRFQIFLSVPETSYVYVYSVDATAWMQRIHPDPERGQVNPVAAGEQRLLPRPDHFFGLDEHTGNQEIWFLVSRVPRPDVEELLAAFPLDRPRAETELRSRSGEPIYQHISKTTVFARGLVEVGPGAQAVVQDEQGTSFELTPARLFSSASEDEIAFSRWFTSQ